MTTYDTIIVGGGITGLSAAHKLKAAGQNIMVFEASERAGDGRIVRVSRDGDTAEGGAQGMHSNYDEMLRLVGRFGLKGDLIQTRGRSTYLDKAGAPRTVNSRLDLAQHMGLRGSTDAARFYSKLKMSKPFSIFEIDQDIPDYDNVTAAEHYKWAGKAFHDYVLRPMMHATTNTVPEETNAYHALNLFRMVTTTETFGLRTGIVTLIERMAEQVPITYGAKVKSVLMTGERVDGVELEDGRAFRADHVILACPLGAAGDIVTDQLPTAQKFLTEFPYTPLPLVFFFLDRPIPDSSWVYMGHPYREAVYNMVLNHATRQEMVPSGKAILSTWAAYPSTIPMNEMSDEQTVQHALRDLDAFIPGVANWVEEARVMKHRRGIARYAPGTHRKILDFKAHAQGLQGISFAGNDYDAVHMESGVRSGYRAAARALRG